MESSRMCKICGDKKPIYEFPKKDKFRYRTECKICYNKSRVEFNKLSEEDKRKIKEDIRIREKNRKLDVKKRKEERELEKENKKKLKYQKLLHEYDERMMTKIVKREMKLKNYLCSECGETDYNNFYPKRKNKCKKCVLLSSQKNYSYIKMNDDEKKIYIEKQREWRSNNLIHYRVESARHRALRKGIVFEITDDDIIEKLNKQGNRCFISNQPISMIENDWYSLSLDRLDNSIGYTKDNTIVVTKFVNTSKNDLSLSVFIKMLKEVCDNV